MHYIYPYLKNFEIYGNSATSDILPENLSVYAGFGGCRYGCRLVAVNLYLSEFS